MAAGGISVAASTPLLDGLLLPRTVAGVNQPRNRTFYFRDYRIFFASHNET